MWGKIGPWEAHIALKNRDIILINRKMESGKLDPNLSFRGESLLTTAVSLNSVSLVKVLLAYGADPTKKSDLNGRGEPPLMTAVRSKSSMEIIIELLKYGAQISQTNFHGEDALFQTISTNALEKLEYFLLQTVHGSCVHRSRSVCPFQAAVKDSQYYIYKMKCLFILLKHNYTCSCLLSNSHIGKFYKEHITKRYEITSRNLEIVNWIYLTTGEKFKLKEKRVLPAEVTLNLKNLSRITIRKAVSISAVRRKSIFAKDIENLPMPTKLIDFLMMRDLLQLE